MKVWKTVAPFGATSLVAWEASLIVFPQAEKGKPPSRKKVGKKRKEKCGKTVLHSPRPPLGGGVGKWRRLRWSVLALVGGAIFGDRVGSTSLCCCFVVVVLG